MISWMFSTVSNMLQQTFPTPSNCKWLAILSTLVLERGLMPSRKSLLLLEIHMEAPESQTALSVSKREALQAVGCWRITWVQSIVSTLKAFRVLSDHMFWVGDINGNIFCGSSAWFSVWFLTWFKLAARRFCLCSWIGVGCPSEHDNCAQDVIPLLSFWWNDCKNGDIVFCGCIALLWELWSFAPWIYANNYFVPKVIKYDTFESDACIWESLWAYTLYLAW